MKSNKKKRAVPNLTYILSLIASRVADAKAEMRATPEAVKYREEQNAFTKQIIDAMNAAKTVEDVVHLEMTLQEMDKDLAHTEQERGSIAKAQTAYGELLRTVNQMRRSPMEYLEANLSISSQDILKIPDVRGPMKIRGNKARLQNRAMFSTEEDGQIWDARIGVADKTESLLRALHKEVMTKMEKDKE